MKSRISFPGGLALLCCLSAPAGAQTDAVSEKDYLEDVPVVLSVSRLPQRLDETPGAVTIIDRDMIRMSGARDVADLLRLVPGFRVSNSFESNTPQGSYHTSLSDYSNHLQVMVDGRSVYSTYMQGSTGPGLQTVALEDIERIEVYRGSNSSAYGARAFLGSINIVTRDPVDTQGVMVKAAGGSHGISDQMARLGWGNEEARFRLSADNRSDDGLSGTSGSDRVQRFNLRADLRTSATDVVELRTGQSLIDAGVGFDGVPGNNVRTRRLETSFAQMDWRRSLNADQDLQVQASYTAERVRDQFDYDPIPGVLVDFGGQSSNANLMAQHTVRVNEALRMVWGGELRRESVTSQALYDTDAAYVTDFSRLFANAEWRLYHDWLLNAGGMFEHSSIAGSNFSPRLMLNWQAAPGQTFRAGISKAFRPPSTYEKYANVRYFNGSTLLDSTYVARGNVVAERVEARELGYLAESADRSFSLDVRVFDERVRDYIGAESYSLPGSGNDNMAYDYVNNEDFTIRGAEAQLRWRPWSGGQLIYSLSPLDSTQSYGATAQVGRYNINSLMFMQKLPQDWEFSVSYYRADGGYYPGRYMPAPDTVRTDVRVAKALRLSGHPAEIALVGQSINGAYTDFRPEFTFQKRVFLTLKVEQ